MGDYKNPIRHTFDARYNLFKELSETDNILRGEGHDLALLEYFMMSAMWSPRGNKVGQGVVPEKWASPKYIMKYTRISRSTVYRVLARLEDDAWIEVEEIKPGEIRVRVRLDAVGRRARAKVLTQRQEFSQGDKPSHTETSCLTQRLDFQPDLAKWALKN